MDNKIGKKNRQKIIRSTVNNYLKTRNYLNEAKYRKSDLNLCENINEFILKKMIDADTSHTNSFLYSNVLCLTNQFNAVEQHFIKFVQFIQNQENPIKEELSLLFGPIICHIYIELLKGQEWKIAYNFLRNNAHLVGVIEHLNDPLPNIINDSSVNSLNLTENSATSAVNTNTNLNSSDINLNSFPTQLTQISFVKDKSIENSVRNFFKDIVEKLSTCLKYELLNNINSIVELKSSKYEIQLSYISIKTLKKFLEKQGHVIILNILHKWIHFIIKDFKDPDEENDILNLEDDIKGYLNSQIHQTHLNENDNQHTGSKEDKRLPTNLYFRNLIYTLEMTKEISVPPKTLKIIDPEKSLSSVTIDPDECHIAAAFGNSSVKLWQLSGDAYLGRNLYEKFHIRNCCWISGNQHKCDINEDEENEKLNPTNINKINEFYAEKCEENSFDDSGGIVLRGHSRGVTDCLFSKQLPLLFTSSKDNTIRAWKAENYSCSVIYRGHNYPVWCLNESPIENYIASGSKDYTARLWNIEYDYPLITYVGHTQDIDCIAFHPNGNYLATGSSDMTIRLWSVTCGKLFRVFTECHQPIINLEFSPNGKYLAAGSEESKIRIFDLAAGSQISEFKGHKPQVAHFAWNKSGNKITSCSADGIIKTWDIKINSNIVDDPVSVKNLCCFETSLSRPIKVFYNSNDLITIIGRTSLKNNKTLRQDKII